MDPQVRVLRVANRVGYVSWICPGLFAVAAHFIWGKRITDTVSGRQLDAWSHCSSLDRDYRSVAAHQ